MTRLPPKLDWRTQFELNFAGEIAVDLFAGGGGASTAYELATGRPVDVAINHDPDAVSMHTINHSHAEHYVSDVFEVCPIAACRGRPVGHLHASPDCTHFSQALGGQPRKRAIRALAWVVIKWAGKKHPRILTLENVEQMLQWSPLIAKRDRATGRVVTLDLVACPRTGRMINRVADPGERVPIERQFLVPDPRRRGHSWRNFVKALRRLGYAVQWRTLAACDYGAGTTRNRLYLVARCDGRPIVWPEKTHSRRPTPGRKRAVSAADSIDFSIPSHSIFLSREEGRAAGVKRPLADATLKRIAAGIQRFVLDSGDPFIVPVTHQGGPGRVHDVQEPLRTITAANRGELAVATAFMAQANGGFNETPGHDLRGPMTTITNRGSQQQLVTAHLYQHQMPSAQEAGALRIAAFLMRYHSTGGQWSDLRDPMTTITTADRLALVTVLIRGIPYVIVDICLRMLTPRELYRAQGFPDSYIIDRGHDARRFSKSAQVRFVGNSVSPPPLAAIIRSLHGVDAINEYPAPLRAAGGAA